MPRHGKHPLAVWRGILVALPLALAGWALLGVLLWYGGIL